jgi:signal peptidase II
VQPSLIAVLARASALCLLVTAIDGATKMWVRGQPALRGALRPVLGRWLSLTWAENPGAAFGMFAQAEHRGVLFAVVAVLAVAGGAWALRSLRGQLVLLPEFVGLLVGGAMGNSLDRLLRGSVTDFVVLSAPPGPLATALDRALGGHTWPAFNVADMAIVGAMIAAVPLLLVGQRDAADLPPAPPTTAQLD